MNNEPGFIHRIPAIPSSVTAGAILAALLTVDGTGSGLDADLLNGQHGAFYTSYTDTAIANLLALPDPFPQYLTQTEGDGRYSLLGHNHDLVYAPIIHQHKLNDLQNPTANTLLSMGNNHFKLTFDQPIVDGGIDGAFELEVTGAFTGDVLHIHQHTGTPAAGVDLVHLEAASINVLPLRIVTTGVSIAANITGRTDLTGTTGTAGLRDFNITPTATAGSGGIRIKSGSASADVATVELLGRRTNSAGSNAYGGALYLAKHRTDAKTASGSRLGRILFGGNHTDGTETNILYGAMIGGYADSDLNSAVDFPVGIGFYTGTAGITSSSVTELSALTLRMDITPQGTIAFGAAATTATTTIAQCFNFNCTFNSSATPTLIALNQNVVMQPTADTVTTIIGQQSQITSNKIGATAYKLQPFRSSPIISATNTAPVDIISCFLAVNPINNSAVSIAAIHGFECPDFTTTATLRTALFGQVSAGAGKWNLHCIGTAINYLNGALLIGTTTDDGANKLQVTGNSKITGNFEATGTTTISGYPTNARTLTGTLSVAGGGDLSANRTFSLVNDSATPGNSMLYGTDGSGTKGWYAQPGGGSPAGILSDLQFSLLQSDGTLNAASGVQTWAGTNKTGQDVFTVAANTTYRIRGQWIINTGSTTHTTAMAFEVSGATVTSLEYLVTLWSAAANAIAAAQATTHVTGVASRVLTGTSAAVYTIIQFEGILVIGANGGTITPQINFSANPTGTNLMKQGSWVSFEKLGTDTVELTGGWA